MKLDNDHTKELDILFNVLAHDQIKFEKTRINDDNFIIGCRSTHIVTPNVFDFLHDLSHLIQFSDKELQTHYIEYGGRLNFNTPMVYVYNQWCCEPETDQISMRELETFYIQYLLENQILNLNLSFESWVDKYEVLDLFQWLPDQWIFGYKPTIEHVLNKASKIIEKWTFDKAFARWQAIKVM